MYTRIHIQCIVATVQLQYNDQRVIIFFSHRHANAQNILFVQFVMRKINAVIRCLIDFFFVVCVVGSLISYFRLGDTGNGRDCDCDEPMDSCSSFALS